METLAADLEIMRRVPLADAHVAALRTLGTEREYPAGALIAEANAPMDRFIYVLSGEVEVDRAATKVTGRVGMGMVHRLGEEGRRQAV